MTRGFRIPVLLAILIASAPSALAQTTMTWTVTGVQRQALAGVAIGLIAALAFQPPGQRSSFGVKATDPITFGGIALLLTIVAFAARIDPMISLRYE